jgi:hypothetical protein
MIPCLLERPQITRQLQSHPAGEGRGAQQRENACAPTDVGLPPADVPGQAQTKFTAGFAQKNSGCVFSAELHYYQLLWQQQTCFE